MDAPTHQPAEIAAARDAVVEAARAQNASGHEDGCGSLAFRRKAIATREAVEALDALLTPPEPMDAVAELREAAALAADVLSGLGATLLTVRLEGSADFAKSASDRLRAALSALEAR